MARRAIATSEDFLLSGRSLPAWVTGLAFISANLGAIEILGMAANGAQYGISDRALLLDRRRPGHGLPRPGDDAVLLRLPGPQRPRVPAPPVQQRPTHLFNALTFAAGRGAHRRGQPVRAGPGHPEPCSAGRSGCRSSSSAGFVLAYITLGGLSGAIYNEVLQFFVILAGLIPLVIVGLTRRRRLERPEEQDRRSTKLAAPRSPPGAARSVGHPTNPLGDWIGIVFGLGFVLSFGYWTTNFAEVQRALVGQGPVRRAADAAHRRVPEDLHPGADDHPRPDRPRRCIAADLGDRRRGPDVQRRDPAADGQVLLPNGVLGIALTGLLAAFMAGMAANVQLLQHGLHLRHLAAVLPAGTGPTVLPAGRALRHRGRGAHRHRHGVHRLRLHEHHELHPAAVLVLQRAAVRDVHHRRCSGSAPRRGPASGGWSPAPSAR